MAQHDYSTGLSEFVDKQITRWGKQKKDFLELKFQKNYESVTNRDYRVKKWKKKEGEGWRSDTWIGFIRVKVWTLFALFLDTMLQKGQIPFNLKPDPDEPPDLPPDYQEERDRRIDRMKDKIKGQLLRRKADRECMKEWLSMAYYGMAFSKFDVDDVISRVFKQVDMGLGNVQQYLSPEEAQSYTRYELAIMTEKVPGHRYVSVWNLVWDTEVDNLKDGDGYAERIPTSTADLRKLLDKGDDLAPGYIEDKIKDVLSRTKDRTGEKNIEISSLPPGERAIHERRRNISRYEYSMTAPRKLVDEFERSMKERHKVDRVVLGSVYEDGLMEDDGDEVEIMGEIADKEIIRHIRNDTGKRNMLMCVLERALDESHGIGVADNMEDVQASLIGMIRAFEDNKKLSANITTAVKSRYFTDPSQLDDIVPGKKYEIDQSCDDVRKAILPITYPDIGETLVSGIGLMERWKDDVSMVPTILQGFNLPKQQSDTAFELNQMMQNSYKYIGMIVQNNDEMMIEPKITDIYEYNMEFDEDDSIKVNCKATAEGFTGFRSNILRGESIKAVFGMVLSNPFLTKTVKINPHLKPIYESIGEDPDVFIKTEQELQQELEREQQAQQMAQQAFEEKANQDTQKALQLQAEQKKQDAAAKSQQDEEAFQRDILKEAIGATK